MEIRKRIDQHLHMLCEEIGARPTGSVANQRAVTYVCEELKRAGLNVSLQEFDCFDWTENGASLTAGDRVIPAVPAPYSLPCDVQGELLFVRSLEELRTAPLSGKIVLLCDTLASEPLMPKSFLFWNPDEHKETIALLEQGGVKAVLTASLSPEGFVPVIEDGDFKVPCAIVLPENLSGLREGNFLSLSIHADRRPTKAANVLAAYGNGEHKVCFSAHIDTKPGTPGALDNASGVAVLLALASELSGRQFPYQIEFVLFNGEDYYSTPGEMAYLASHLSAPEKYICAFNIDGVGAKGQNLAYSFYECPQKLTDTLSGLAASKDMEQIPPWPQGDHTLFSFSGVPAIAITSSHIFDYIDTILHTPTDTPALISPEKLEHLVTYLLTTL